MEARKLGKSGPQVSLVGLGCNNFGGRISFEETLRALDDLIRQGKVAYVGNSNFTAAQVVEAHRTAAELNLHDHLFLHALGVSWKDASAKRCKLSPQPI